MSTLAAKVIEPIVSATGVHFVNNVLCVSLNDGREISVPIDKISWLDWLAKATPEQRMNWTLEPDGFAIYWEDLDDGIEITHLLGMNALV
jgi:hypothetical protein